MINEEAVEVLIVAKCNVNKGTEILNASRTKVLIVAKCNVNSKSYRITC